MASSDYCRFTDIRLANWPVYLIGVHVILSSLLNIGGGWLPIYVGAYSGSQLADPEVAQEMTVWAEERQRKHGQDAKWWDRVDSRQLLQELEQLEDLPRPLDVVVPLARSFTSYAPILTYIYVPFGLLAGIGLMIFRRWGWWCAVLWLGTWMIVTIIMAVGLRSIATVLSASLMGVNLVITAVALWALFVHRPLFSHVPVEHTPLTSDH